MKGLFVLCTNRTIADYRERLIVCC